MNDKRAFAPFHSLAVILLFPFSLLYGIITYIRNKLYDRNIFRPAYFDGIGIVSIGNITVGGTGKTPMTEYLVRMLSPNYRVAVLSRGYKRTTKGFMFVETLSTAAQAGDEPCQIKRKFPDITVAVATNRIEGIGKICENHPDIQVILLDDAFQYRKIRPTLSILLTDYNRPLFRDSMLPGGRMREWACSAKRADIAVVTKSPAGMSTEEQNDIMHRYAEIFNNKPCFTTVAYGEPVPVFGNGMALSTASLQRYNVLLITGIATPKPYEAYLRKHAASLQTLAFPDHHEFSDKDTERIFKKWENMPSANKVIITTEKDAARLQNIPVPEPVAHSICYIPITVCFTGGGASFEKQVKSAINEHLNKQACM
jgi:tetraacyldisaccharide 4'-kinase